MPTNEPARILVADDQPDVIEALRLLLKNEGFRIQAVSSPAGVVAAVRAQDYDVALVDLNYTRDTTSGREGLDLLVELQAVDATLPVVVMTAWGSIELAVEAMRRGARDFVEKPWQNARLLATLRTQLELGRALRRSERLEAHNHLLHADGGVTFIAECEAMRPVVEMLARIGPAETNVLITGESGSGKGIVARALHANSPRARNSFVTVNTGGLAENLFESELFGHVKGAFTDAKADRAGRFELADGGTLFLDEIANITLAQQARLLRVIESGEFERVGSSRTRRVNVRVICATNADLRAEAAAGRFREDLLFRLNTVEIHVPALRERRDEIPRLAAHFLGQHAKRYRRDVRAIDPAAMKAMMGHPWPGNVRELDHALERAVLMARGETIQISDLALSAGQAKSGAVGLEDLSLEEVENLLIQKALARHGGNVSQAATALGLSRGALYRRLQRYGL